MPTLFVVRERERERERMTKREMWTLRIQTRYGKKQHENYNESTRVHNYQKNVYVYLRVCISKDQTKERERERSAGNDDGHE